MFLILIGQILSQDGISSEESETHRWYHTSSSAVYTSTSGKSGNHDDWKMTSMLHNNPKWSFSTASALIHQALQAGPYTPREKNDTKNEKTVLGSQKRVFWTACILIIIVETSTLTIKKESSKSDNFQQKSIGGSLEIFLKIGTNLTNSQQEVSKARC